MKRKALHKLQLRNQAEGDLRQAQERAYERVTRAGVWRFDPSSAQIFDVIVHPACDDKEIRVDVNVIEPGGVNQHTRIMRNDRRAWREIAKIAARASNGFTDYVGGAR